ncbi:MAG TPA: hypothetical protein VFU84_07860 [Gaiellaceae bacterium]|nr:hypothetical protein [Gaiellaceae bacterium]
MVVVSSSKLDKDALWGVVAPDDELHVVVPVVKQSRLQWLTNDEDEARADAQAVGDKVAKDAPADASDVDVKPDPPQQVVRDAIAEHRPDRVVVALRDGEDATWLEEGGLDELPGAIDGIPVDRIRI